MDFRDEVIQLTPSGVKYKVCGRLGRGGSADVFKVQCLAIPENFREEQVQRNALLQERLTTQQRKWSHLAGSTSQTPSHGSSGRPNINVAPSTQSSTSGSTLGPPPDPDAPAFPTIENPRYPELSTSNNSRSGAPGTGSSRSGTGNRRRLSGVPEEIEEANEDYNVANVSENPSGSTDLQNATALMMLKQPNLPDAEGLSNMGRGEAGGAAAAPDGTSSSASQSRSSAAMADNSGNGASPGTGSSTSASGAGSGKDNVSLPDWYKAPGESSGSGQFPSNGSGANSISGASGTKNLIASANRTLSGNESTNPQSQSGVDSPGGADLDRDESSDHPAYADAHLILDDYQIPFLEEGKFYALKSVMAHNQAEFQVFLREVDLLQKLAGNPYVIHLLDVTVLASDKQLFLVLELAEADFGRYLTLNHNLHLSQILNFWIQMVIAVRTMHRDHDVIHFDLKPANFLMVGGRLKLADFGLARQLGEDHTHVSRTNRAGTLKYMAPECIYQPHASKLRLGKESDVWSLGIILCRMIYNTTPHAHLQDNHTRMLIAISDTRTKINLVDCPRLYVGEQDMDLGMREMKELHDWMINVARGCLIFEPRSRFNSEDLYFLLDRKRYPTAAVTQMLRDKTDQYTGALDSIQEADETAAYGAVGPHGQARTGEVDEDDVNTKVFGPTGAHDKMDMRLLQRHQAADKDHADGDLEKQALLGLEDDEEEDVDEEDDLEEIEKNRRCMVILIVLLSVIVVCLIACIVAAVLLHQKRMQAQEEPEHPGSPGGE
mmetsp:Transcript_4345/g.10619  ORF Transcript_4345/g.10619 Transcript_4345/m.10619 type:complete len:776 (+) Transcript_4345:512-2839(+)|eukprot:CAMPEP_0178991658 /NCGR_PEP_ID=MMETSP0795-20121207/5657_1 /TAXON_ID=88552 /ORGANISM="Amoebophrya sp., Strain Ameob2" /LENGTH=775 /DNA_ID=CAMNT_0020683405 /DNA_START=429 /DNA_END=2756 /DNA_ORIENTATION=+